MKRRKFIKASSLLLGGSSLLTSCYSSRNEKKQTALKAFIVSDAHIGWIDDDQPSINHQNNCIKNIINDFPDLDLAFDTGDAHHGYLNESERVVARTQWLENIANQFHKTPFHYIPGNHELGKGESDPEIVAANFGSIPFRPYYAFDQMGIHFISLPELLSTILITKETLNWLELDLQVNKDKTTIILSHNSIKDTTFNNEETGYRCLANSDEVINILDKNPQIVAWFHGHNHQYEIVKIKNRVYVSNGRIGGFNPPLKWGDFGQGHLGGVYFEVSKHRLIIKAYSASKKAMLSDLGFSDLSIELDVETTFNPLSEFNYYCGHGKAIEEVKYKINNHYLTEKGPTLVYQTIEDSINENSSLNYPTGYFFSGKQLNKILGFKLNTRQISFKQNNKNIRIFNPKSINSFILSFSIYKNKKHGLYRRGSYYRVAWNQGYKVKIIASNKVINKISLDANLLDNNYNLLKKLECKTDNVKENTIVFKLNTGDKMGLSPLTYLTIDIKFNNSPKEFEIDSIELLPEKSINIGKVEIHYSSNTHKIDPQSEAQSLRLNTIKKTNENFEVRGTNGEILVWLLKYSNISWQIRNGYGVFTNNRLSIEPNNSDYHKNRSIIISPTARLSFYLNIATNTSDFVIDYTNAKKCIIKLSKITNKEIFEFYSTLKPQAIKNAVIVNSKIDGFLIQPKDRIFEILF